MITEARQHVSLDAARNPIGSWVDRDPESLNQWLDDNKVTPESQAAAREVATPYAQFDPELIAMLGLDG